MATLFGLAIAGIACGAENQTSEQTSAILPATASVEPAPVNSAPTLTPTPPQQVSTVSPTTI